MYAFVYVQQRDKDRQRERNFVYNVQIQIKWAECARKLEKSFAQLLSFNEESSESI